MRYDPRYPLAFYDRCGEREWTRLTATRSGQLLLHAHLDVLRTHIRRDDEVLELGAGAGRLTCELVRLGARVVLLTDVQLDAEENLRVIQVRNIQGERSEALFPLVISATLPRLLHLFAKGRGIEAGSFRYGGKVTTRE